MTMLADQLTDVLIEAGVERVYGVVGDSLNPLVDAVRRAEGIEWVHVRNEEAGAFAASAEAQLTGRLAVCAGSCGPGNTHLIQGLYDANRTGAPVLAIASQIPSVQVGTGFFQETHPERLLVECSEFCEIVSQAEQMPRVARTAVQHALGREAVSVLVVSGDVLHRDPVHPTGESAVMPATAVAMPPSGQVQALSERLNAAETVTLFCGAGVRGAHAEVMALAGKVHSPIGHTLRGKEWIQYDNPYDVGMSGLLGYGACYDASHEADLLVLLGTDFPYNDFPTRARALVAPPQRQGGQAQYVERLLPEASSHDLGPLRDWMLENLALPHDLDTLARRAHMSRRTLTRRFREETGVSPMRWLADARIDRARELLEMTAEPVENIGPLTGLGAPASVRAAFHRHIGTSPQEYRSLFGHRTPTIR